MSSSRITTRSAGTSSSPTSTSGCASRSAIGAFVDEELAPHAEKREEDKWFESWVFPRMGEFGLLGRSYPEQKTRASKDGDQYVINGSKTYITNGHRADYIVLVTKTDDAAGHDGFTLFLVDMDSAG